MAMPSPLRPPASADPLAKPTTPQSFPHRIQPAAPRTLAAALAQQSAWVSYVPDSKPDLRDLGGSVGWQMKNEQSNDRLSSDDISGMLADCVARGLLPVCFQNCRVTYFSSGWYNKLYALDLLKDGCAQCQDCALGADLPQLLLRVSKPILPFFKVESEVASICFAQDQGIPVPQVYYYDTSGQNTLGLDWIIYERITGSCTIDDYRDQLLDYGRLPSNRRDAWLKLGDEIAGYTRSLRNVAFENIGSLYLDQTIGNRRYSVGPLCMPLFESCPTWVCHPPGPFKNAFELIRALLRLWEHMTTWHREDGTCLHRTDPALTEVEEGALHWSRSSLEEINADTSQQKDDGGNDGSGNFSSVINHTRSHPGHRPEFKDSRRLHAMWRSLDQLVDYLESTYGSSHALPTPARTYLAHRDLHNNNALVQKTDAGDLETAVKAVLDWEFSWTLPDELWYGYLPKSQSQFAIEARKGDGPHRGRIWECSAAEKNLPLELLFDARANAPETGLSWEVMEPIVEAESERRVKDGSYADPYLDAEDMGKFVAACFMMTSSSEPGSSGGGTPRDRGGIGDQDNTDQQQQQQRRPPATGWVLIVRELVDKLGPHVGRRGRGMPRDNLIWLEKLIAAFRHYVGSGADDKKDEESGMAASTSSSSSSSTTTTNMTDDSKP
ncbi:kinase-like protein [Apiospora marii]|uniref:Kinase-like protein n=1 Tax=Apiospora marii TaxID=335849 RepID=A0ABR1S6K2_9PEZI